MKKSSFCYLALIMSIVFVGCQKELSIDGLGGGSGAGGNSALIGAWKFLELSAKTESDVLVTDGADTERAITTSQYTTMNNKGTVTFDATKMISSGIGYDIDADAKTYLYANGMLLDSLDFPFAVSIPSSSGEAKYKAIGSDSLYFETGFFSVPGTNPQASLPSGTKYTIVGNILTMNTNSVATKTETSAGLTTTQTNKVIGAIKLQKQ